MSSLPARFRPVLSPKKRFVYKLKPDVKHPLGPRSMLCNNANLVYPKVTLVFVLLFWKRGPVTFLCRLVWFYILIYGLFAELQKAQVARVV